MGSYLAPTPCADEYTAALTLGPSFACDHASVTVGANATDTHAALYQLALGTPGDWRWIDEREFTAVPETITIGNIIGVRFRNKVAGQVATVEAFLLGPTDPDVSAGTPL